VHTCNTSDGAGYERASAWTFLVGVALGVAATLYGLLGLVDPGEIPLSVPQVHPHAAESVLDQAVDNVVVVSLVQ